MVFMILNTVQRHTEAGVGDALLDEDYDPAKHDQMMNELFNDDYYEQVAYFIISSNVLTGRP